MDRRTFISSSAAAALSPLLISKAANASGSTPLRGFMLDTADKREIQEDIARLVNLGATIVRFPIYFSSRPSLEEWLDLLEAAYSVTALSNTVLVIDIHHPGSLANSTIENVNDFVAKWSRIAERFSGRRRRIWYDLCNEPEPMTLDGFTWRDAALLAAQAIRRYDNRHRIVFSAEGSTTFGASQFTPLPGISRQILQFHFYNWPDLQFNLAPAYPTSGSDYTRRNMDRLLREVNNVGKRHNMPIYIGEVAINQAHPNAPRFLRDFTSICDQLGIHLTVHAYRESEVWDYERNPRAWNVLTRWLKKD